MVGYDYCYNPRKAPDPSAIHNGRQTDRPGLSRGQSLREYFLAARHLDTRASKIICMSADADNWVQTTSVKK